MNVFISYSVSDVHLVNRIGEILSQHSNVYYWDKSMEPGQDAWEGIFQWIDNANIVLAIITDETVNRAMSVGQEIGRAITNKKLIIPLVKDTIQPSQLGSLSGITQVRFNNHNLGECVDKINRYIMQKGKEHQAAQKKKEMWNNVFLGGLAVMALYALSSSSEDEYDEME